MRLHGRFAMFCLVGFCSFLIDWGFFNLFYGLGAGFILARFSSAGISMIFNFNINRNITFSGRGSCVKRQIRRWLAVYIVAIGFNVGFGKLILIIFGENVVMANIAFFLGIGVAIPISFLGSLLWVFREG